MRTGSSTLCLELTRLNATGSTILVEGELVIGASAKERRSLWS
jgi:hypothetical protein